MRPCCRFAGSLSCACARPWCWRRCGCDRIYWGVVLCRALDSRGDWHVLRVASWLTITDVPPACCTVTGMAAHLARGARRHGWPCSALSTLAHGRLPCWLSLGASGRLGLQPALLIAGAIAVAPILLRSDPQPGFWRSFSCLRSCGATDIVAYFLGRAIGGAKTDAATEPEENVGRGGVRHRSCYGCGVVVATGGGLTAILALAALAGILSIFAQGGDLLRSRTSSANLARRIRASSFRDTGG